MVVVTGQADEETGSQALLEGAQDYLIKADITHALLLRALLYAQERKRAQDHQTQLRQELELRVQERTQELAQANLALQKSEETYRLLADTVSDTIWQADADLRITYVSPSVTSRLGYTPAEIAGEKHIPSPTPRAPRAHASRPAGLAGLRQRAALARYHTFEQTAKDGSKVWSEIKAAVLRDQEGNVQSLIGVTRDISERKRWESALLEAKEQAEAANQAKSQFLANMSHEIRTPMNAIIGMTELVLDSELNPEQREFLEIVHSSSDALLALINDILDLSKIEAGKLDLESVSFSLRDSLEDSSPAWRSRPIKRAWN